MHRLILFAHCFANAVRLRFDEPRRAEIVEPGIGALRLDDRVIIAAIGDVDDERPKPSTSISMPSAAR
jgi:hypothetical protein